MTFHVSCVVPGRKVCMVQEAGSLGAALAVALVAFPLMRMKCPSLVEAAAGKTAPTVNNRS